MTRVRHFLSDVGYCIGRVSFLADWLRRDLRFRRQMRRCHEHLRRTPGDGEALGIALAVGMHDTTLMANAGRELAESFKKGMAR